MRENDERYRKSFDRGQTYDRMMEKRQSNQARVRVRKIDSFIDAFVEQREQAKLSKETLRSYLHDLGVFASWLKQNNHPQDPAKWDSDFIRSYIGYLQKKPLAHGVGTVSDLTVTSYTSRLLAFLKWLYVEGYTYANLAENIKKPKSTQRVILPFADAEVTSIANAAKDDPRCGLRDHAMVILLLDTGIRVSELCGIKPQDIFWQQDLIRVLGKGDKERLVPIAAYTKRALRNYELSDKHFDDRADTFFQTEEGWALMPKTVGQIMDKLGERANVDDVHAHRFRHTMAINFLRKGGNVIALQRILGHSTLAMTNKYLLMVTDDLQREHHKASVVDKFFG